MANEIFNTPLFVIAEKRIRHARRCAAQDWMCDLCHQTKRHALFAVADALLCCDCRLSRGYDTPFMTINP